MGCSGIDTGVFLIRNHPFIRDLLNTLEKEARRMPLPATQVGALPLCSHCAACSITDLGRL